MAATTNASEMLEQIVLDGLTGYMIRGRFIPRMAGAEDDPKPEDPPKPDDKKDDDDDFDKERALATIRKLRDAEQAGKATAKQLDSLQAKLKAIEDKDKSETERATAAAKEASEKLAAAEARLAEERIGRIVERAAGKMGFHDPDDAYRLIDRKAVEMDADGEPKNVDDLLKALAKAKPHLVKVEGDGTTTPPAQRGTPPTPKPNGKAQTRDELIAEKAKKLRESGSYARLG